MATIDTLLKIRADATQAVRGLKPLQTSLQETAQDAQTTEAALDGLDGTHNIHVNDAEVEAARQEVERLRNMMRDQLRADVNADTSDAEKRIKQLQKTIKVLDAQQPVVEVAVQADTSGLAGLRGALGDITSEVSSGGLAGGLGGIAAGLKGAGAAGAGAVVGIGAATKAIWGLGQQAADVQTSIVQLNALTQGKGEETFANLQEFATTTPFALDEVTEATKRLVAAGVPLEDIPDTLSDLGNVAAATGVPIEQIATVFAQMVSKGKASYEELAQLAEAGIPVWQTLADKLGLTVAETQKLATEGKLGADAILLLQESMNELYPTAMVDQAETFNGQMSTLKDNLAQVGQELGTVFLPLMTDMIYAFGLIVGPILKGAAALADFNTELENNAGIGLAKMSPLGIALDALDGGLWDTETAWKAFGSSSEDATAGLTESVLGGLEAVQDTEAATKQLEEALKATVAAFGEIGGSVRTTVDFIISKDDLEKEIRTAIEGVDKEGIEDDIPPIQLPATLKLGDVADLSDQQQEFVGLISEFVQTGLDEGARRAEIVPGFDEDAWYRQVRHDTQGLLIDAGVDPKAANRVLENLFGLPRKVPTSADVSGAKDDLAELNGTPIEVIPKPPKSLRRPESPLDPFKTIKIPEETPAPIVPEVDPAGVKDTNAAIGNVAKPDGAARVAPVKVKIDPVSLMNAFFTLAALTATQTKTIKVHFEENPTGDTLNPATVGALMGASRAMTVTAPAGAAAGTTQAPRQLAPRQAPVQVLLDGAVIADRLDLRRSLAATESVRRTA